MHILHTYTHSVPARTDTNTYKHINMLRSFQTATRRKKENININIFGYTHLQVKLIMIPNLRKCSPVVSQLHKVISRTSKRG